MMRLANHRSKCMHGMLSVHSMAHGKRRWCDCERADGLFVCVPAYVIVRVHVPEHARWVVRGACTQHIYARQCLRARLSSHVVPSFIDADLLTCTWSWLTSPALSLLLRDVPNPPGLDALPSKDERAEFDPLKDHEPLLRWLNKACGDRDLSESALDRKVLTGSRMISASMALRMAMASGVSSSFGRSLPNGVCSPAFLLGRFLQRVFGGPFSFSFARSGVPSRPGLSEDPLKKARCPRVPSAERTRVAGSHSGLPAVLLNQFTMSIPESASPTASSDATLAAAEVLGAALGGKFAWDGGLWVSFEIDFRFHSSVTRLSSPPYRFNELLFGGAWGTQEKGTLLGLVAADVSGRVRFLAFEKIVSPFKSYVPRRSRRESTSCTFSAGGAAPAPSSMLPSSSCPHTIFRLTSSITPFVNRPVS